MEMALFSSTIGDLSSDVITILAIGPIALLAMQIGPPELAAVILVSLIIIAVNDIGRSIERLAHVSSRDVFSDDRDRPSRRYVAVYIWSF